MFGTADETQYAKVRRGGEIAPIQSADSFVRRTATLETSTICVDVKDISWGWTEPTELIFKANRLVFTLLVSGSTKAIETGYAVDGMWKPNKIGSVVLTLPDREVLSRAQSMTGQVQTITCSFDREYAEHVVGPLADLSQSQLLNCLNVHSSLLPSILLRLGSEARHPGFVSTAVVESLGHAMLVESSHMIFSDRHMRVKRGRLTPLHFRIIDEYIANLSGETPSIEAIAKACGMSVRYLAKLFREQMNQSIGQYLKAAQISKARAYLLETDVSLKEISYRLGFSTPGNFSMAFRAATGETPGRFRAANSSRSQEDDSPSLV